MKFCFAFLFLASTCLAQDFDYKTISRADIKKTVEHLQELTKDAQSARANAEAQTKTAIKKQDEALAKSDALQIAINAVSKERDEYKDKYATDEVKIKALDETNNKLILKVNIYRIIASLVAAVFAYQLVPMLFPQMKIYAALVASVATYGLLLWLL